MSTSRLLAALIAFAACGDVSSPTTDTCGTDVLPNGSFDGTPGWGQDPVAPGLLCGKPTINPDSGVAAACLGSTDGTTQTLTQTVELPDGASSVTLLGKVCITSRDTAAAEHDLLTFDLLDGGAVIAAIGKQTNRDGMSACDFKALELTAPILSNPGTATLRIRSTLDADLPTAFYVDSLQLNVSCTK